MFLQETKTKRGGKTYVSYLVRESFRTANGPRGRTICNLTHLPKEVRDMVADALRGKSLVALERLEVSNIHAFGGCVALEDAARRHSLQAMLTPLSPRNGGLVHAMIFGGLLFPASTAPFATEARAARLAMFCGLDADREHFEPAEMATALRELDERWPNIQELLMRMPHAEARAAVIYKSNDEPTELAAMGMDATGMPAPLAAEKAAALLQHGRREIKGAAPLLIVGEEMSATLKLEANPHLIELGQESVAALLRQLNPAQLVDAVRAGGPVEVRHHGGRHILVPPAQPTENESQARMGNLGSIGSIRDLTTLAQGKSGEPPTRPAHAGTGQPGPESFQGLTTNVPAERLPAAMAIEWVLRARMARAAFAPVRILVGNKEEPLAWRNHRNLQFLTHRLRWQLHAEWRARGETRPVEEVLRELQEVHRATLILEGIIVRRSVSHPSGTVAELLKKLGLGPLFEGLEGRPG